MSKNSDNDTSTNDATAATNTTTNNVDFGGVSDVQNLTATGNISTDNSSGKQVIEGDNHGNMSSVSGDDNTVTQTLYEQLEEQFTSPDALQEYEALATERGILSSALQADVLASVAKLAIEAEKPDDMLEAEDLQGPAAKLLELAPTITAFVLNMFFPQMKPIVQAGLALAIPALEQLEEATQ